MGSQHSLLKGLKIHTLAPALCWANSWWHVRSLFLPQVTHKTKKKLVKDLLFHQDKVCTNSQICLLEIYPPDAKSQNSVANCPIYDLIQSLETTYKRWWCRDFLVKHIHNQWSQSQFKFANKISQDNFKTLYHIHMYLHSTYSSLS